MNRAFLDRHEIEVKHAGSSVPGGAGIASIVPWNAAATMRRAGLLTAARRRLDVVEGCPDAANLALSPRGRTDSPSSDTAVSPSYSAYKKAGVPLVESPKARFYRVRGRNLAIDGRNRGLRSDPREQQGVAVRLALRHERGSEGQWWTAVVRLRQPTGARFTCGDVRRRSPVRLTTRTAWPRYDGAVPAMVACGEIGTGAVAARSAVVLPAHRRRPQGDHRDGLIVPPPKGRQYRPKPIVLGHEPPLFPRSRRPPARAPSCATPARASAGTIVRKGRAGERQAHRADGCTHKILYEFHDVAPVQGMRSQPMERHLAAPLELDTTDEV